MSTRVSIIDGNNFFHRTFWQNCDVKSYSKSLQGVVNNWLLMRQNSLKNQRVIMVFDTCKSERRLALYPEYKGHRKTSLSPEQYEMFQRVFPVFIEICRKSGLSVLDGDGYEADDYIALLSFMLRNNHLVTILSTDGDFPQLIDDRISIYSPNKKITITKENFENVFEIKQKYYLDFKCMVGDTSDNIGNIEGVGDKTAIKYILQYGNYEQIVEELKKKNEGKKKPSVIETRIIEGSDIIKRNKELMDLSIVKTDMRLRQLIKEKVQGQKRLDRNEMFKYLSEHEIGHLFKEFEKCKS
jgi:DNA polymerase I